MPPRAKPEARWNLSFVLAIPFGLAMLWATGLVAMFIPTFVDCFGPEDECRAMWEIQKVQRDVLLAIVCGLTVISIVALALGRRRAPIALFAASCACLLLGVTPGLFGAQLPSWMPPGLLFTAPGLLILALASAGQAQRWTESERRRRAFPAIRGPVT